MSADISILNIPSIQGQKLTLECYLIHADGGLRYLFDEEEPTLERVALILLISLISPFKEAFNNPLTAKYPEMEDASYAGSEELKSLIQQATIRSFNLDFDIDILDDSSHPDHPNNRIREFGWNRFDPHYLDREAISHLPRVEIILEFTSPDLLHGIPEGIWNRSACDTCLDWLL